MLKSIIKDSEFENFIQGSFGNSGQNIYVSRKGNIQRIHHFDINGDGYIDLPFANSHDDDNRVPAYVYTNPLNNNEKIELTTEGSFAGAVGDLNNDGYDDLVIANQYDGVSNSVYSQIYYGSPNGLSEKRAFKIWAPFCTDVAIGDFNGDGRKDIIFISSEKLRIFYQKDYGFKVDGYIDINIDLELESITAHDLDNDGFDDLVIRLKDSRILIVWGSEKGIVPENCMYLDETLTGKSDIGITVNGASSGANDELNVYQLSMTPALKVVKLMDTPHIFISRNESAVFIPVTSSRTIGEAMVLKSGHVTSAAVGDINGDGYEDIVLASRCMGEDGKEASWIYWGGYQGYSNDNRTSIFTMSARDVTVGDIDNDGCDDIVFCQDKTDEMYSIESFIYKGMPEGVAQQPVKLSTHCAADAFIAHTSDDRNPQVIFINYVSNHILGNVNSYIYLGNKDGFSEDRRIELPGWAPTEIKACDFNDDGYVDLFFANSNENAQHMNNGSFLYRGGPEGYDISHRIELPTKNCMSSCCGDINKDGYLDLIVCGFKNDEILVFYGSENGFESEPVRIKLDIQGVRYDNPRYMTLADFNNDGWLDLVVPQAGGEYTTIFWGSTEGFSNQNVTLLPIGKTVSSRAADLDGDGWLDLIIGGYNGADPRDPFNTFVYIYWGGPKGFSNDRCTQLPASFACDLTVADFNNDGILDIFVNCYHGIRTRDIDSYIYWGEGNGKYSTENRTRLYCHSASGSLAADFNEDGWIDLAVANHKTHGNHPGESYVWWNGPDGFSEDRITRLPTLGPHGMTHMDVGDIFDRGPEEYYTSRVIELPYNADITCISWNADIPEKTWVRAQIRTASNRDDLEKAAWIGSDGENGWFENKDRIGNIQARGKWMQYRLALGAVNSGNSPRISEVIIEYESNR